MKKTGILFVVLLLMLCFVATAEESESIVYTCGDYQYILLADGSAEISDYNGNAEQLSLPEMLDDHPVTRIGENAFKGCDSLVNIYIPNSLIEIGDNPFRECKKLKYVRVTPDHPVYATINGVLFKKADKMLVCYPRALTASNYQVPNGISIVGKYAFYGCDHLDSITLPKGLIEIEEYAFYDCYSMNGRITLPPTVSSIGENAFYKCINIWEIILPDSLTFIGDGAFGECLSLERITIPEGIECIGEYTFKKCVDLDCIFLPKGLKRIGKGAFYGCRSLKSIVIPESVSVIGDSAFQACTGISYVDLPKGLISIGNRAFYGCSGLNEISLPESLTSIGESVFMKCSEDLLYTVERDSFAAGWIKEKGIVNYTYPDALSWLNE